MICMVRSVMGQSIVIDASVYKNINLEKEVKEIIDQLNFGLKPEKYQFKLFNMDTFSESSQYIEQRKSLTYFTLTHVDAPALDIEVSKDLVGPYWTFWKVSCQCRERYSF